MGVKAHMDPFFTLISGCLIVKSLEGKYQAWKGMTKLLIFHKNEEILWQDELLSTSQEQWSMELNVLQTILGYILWNYIKKILSFGQRQMMINFLGVISWASVGRNYILMKSQKCQRLNLLELITRKDFNAFICHKNFVFYFLTINHIN
jgi:hypothetical protein